MNEENSNCGIYCIENIVNGKKYIGQSKNIKNRWREHRRDLKKNCHHSIHLQRAYNKYKIENFVFYIVKTCSEDNLHDMEMFYMKKYNSTDKKFGYNLRSSKQGDIAFNKEYLQKMREVQKSKPIYQIDLSGKIVSRWSGGARHAAKELGFSQSSIWKCCNKYDYTHKDFVWIYCDEYDNGEFDLSYYIEKKLKTKIVQLDKDLNYIKTWDSIIEASRILGLDNSSITKNCKHKKSCCGDYVFEYEKNYLNNKFNPKKPTKNKKIVQLNEDGVFIKTWDKISTIAKNFKRKDNGSIKKACLGIYKTVWGYKWMYLEDYEKLRKEILN